MAENETANALAFLGEWLPDDVQTPTREEINLARSIALALAEIKRRRPPQQVITTADQLRALPVGAVVLWWNRGPAAPPHTLQVVKGDTLACTDGLWYWIDERDEAARIVRAGRLEVAWRPASAKVVPDGH